jgi:NTE family protein
MAAKAIFAGVSTEELERALGQLERRSFPRGAELVAEGDELGEMFVVRTGSADVFVTDRAGGEHLVGHIAVGGTIGEMSLLAGQPAAGTVRATEAVDVVVLGKDQFNELAEAFPRIYRNLVAILSDRLAKTNLLALGEQPGRLILLQDDGASEQLAHALACSIAWHTRSPTLLVVVADSFSDALAATATRPAEAPFRRRAARRGAEVIVTPPTGSFTPDRIRATLEELVTSYEYVLVQVPASWARDLAADETISVAGLSVPALDQQDLEDLRNGMLPLRSGAGRELGRLARTVAGLRVGVALGAGSLRGYAHIGALRGLADIGIPIDFIAGASAGSVVAGLYANGASYERIAEVLDELGKRMFRPTISRRSLLSTRAMRRFIRRRLGDAQIEELPVPLAVIAADALTGEEVVLRQGSLALALLASTSVPGIFPALSVGGHTLVDGGVVDPVPVGVVAQMGAGVAVGVKLMSGEANVRMDSVSRRTSGPLPTSIGAILRSLELMQGRLAVDRHTVPTVVVTPEFEELAGAKMRKFSSGRRFLDNGYTAVERARPALAATLPWLRDA